eukprot:284818025_2
MTQRVLIRWAIAHASVGKTVVIRKEKYSPRCGRLGTGEYLVSVGSRLSRVVKHSWVIVLLVGRQSSVGPFQSAVTYQKFQCQDAQLLSSWTQSFLLAGFVEASSSLPVQRLGRMTIVSRHRRHKRQAHLRNGSSMQNRQCSLEMELHAHDSRHRKKSPAKRQIKKSGNLSWSLTFSRILYGSQILWGFVVCTHNMWKKENCSVMNIILGWCNNMRFFLLIFCTHKKLNLCLVRQLLYMGEVHFLVTTMLCEPFGGWKTSYSISRYSGSVAVYQGFQLVRCTSIHYFCPYLEVYPDPTSYITRIPIPTMLPFLKTSPLLLLAGVVATVATYDLVVFSRWAIQKCNQLLWRAIGSLHVIRLGGLLCMTAAMVLSRVVTT